MPVVEIRKDTEALTMTVVAQFAAPVARVWAAYADPRQLELLGPARVAATSLPRFHGGRTKSDSAMNGPNGASSR